MEQTKIGNIHIQNKNHTVSGKYYRYFLNFTFSINAQANTMKQQLSTTIGMQAAIYKPFLFIAFCLCMQFSLQAQVNLTPNHSFEDTIACPTGLGLISSTAEMWQGVGIPHHFHSCIEDGGGADVPDNIFGVQEALSGEAYAGFTAYTTGNPSQRDYLTVQLEEALQPDTEYCVEFYISLADFTYFGIENIGAYFSTEQVPNNNGSAFGFIPQVENQEGIIADKNGWTQISGTFTAQEAHEWLTIGNFYSSANTNAENLATGGETGFTELGFYYIDSISVVELPPIEINMQGVNVLEQADNVLCIGDAQTLTAIGGTSYQWFNLADPFTLLSDADTLAFEASSTQSYILQTTNFNCLREYIFTLEVRPTPQFDISVEATCDGYNLNVLEEGIDIVSVAEYEWQFYQNGLIIASDSTKGGAELFNTPVDSVLLAIRNLENCFETDTVLIEFQTDCQPCEDGFRNLASNASAEYYHNCPNNLGELEAVSRWQNPTNASTDYFNACANTVPSNLYGSQSPPMGNAYVGFTAFANSDYREYVSVPMLTSLEAGKNYCVRFEVSLADSVGKAISSLGIHFSEDAIGINTQAPLFGFPPQLEVATDSSFSDKENWTTLSGIYQPDSDVSWLTIGNFKDNANTSVIDLDSTFLFDEEAYYYFDNVSVVELPELGIGDTNNAIFETPTVCVGESVIAQAVGDYCEFTWVRADNPLDTLGTEASVALNSEVAGLQQFVVLADFGGCMLTDTIGVNFESFPEISFDIIENCAGAVTIFTDNSLEVEEGAIYSWDFGDGNTIEGLTNVANLYEQTGSYTIALTITNPTGCEASAFESLEITEVCDPCNAENNLVSNPSFEEGICPDLTGQIDRAAFWFSPKTDDRASLFGACNPDDIVGVPDNAFGSQSARTKITYAGIKAYSNSSPDEQQFITNRLGNSLEVGAEYCVSMFVNLADSSDFAISSLGFYFTVVNPTGGNLINVSPQVVNLDTRILSDTTKWVEVSGTFVADEAYQFLTIGNFKNVLNTQEFIFIDESNPTGFAYYYIDDLSVTPMEISASEDVEICEGESVTLTGDSNTCETYWVNANKPLNVVATGNSLTVNPQENTTYLFVGQNGNCQVTEAVEILVKPPPRVDTISTNPNICKGESIPLLVALEEAGDYSIQWSPAETLINSSTPMPITLADTTMTYYVNITNTTTNCSITDSVLLTVNELPVAILETDSVFICAGDSLRISAAGGDVFAWSPVNAVSDTTIADPFVYSPSATLNLSVTVRNSQTGCSDTTSLVVEAGNTYPMDTTRISLCEGQKKTINDVPLGILNVPPDEDILEYHWGPNINLSNDTIRNPVTSATFDIVYTLYFVDKDGCEGIVSVEVDVNQVPNVGPDVSICEGGSVQLNAISSGNVASYQWLPLDGLSDATIPNPIASPDDTTTYIVKATYINQTTSCVTIDTITVFVNERGATGTSGDAIICRGDSLQVNAFGGNIFEWTPTKSLTDPNIANPKIFPEETTTYQVRIFNSTTQCESFDSLTITVKEEAMPIILSPDSVIYCAEPLVPLELCLDVEYDGCEPLEFNVLTQLSSDIVQLNESCFTYESAFATARHDTIEIQICTAQNLQCDTTTAILIYCDTPPMWTPNPIQRNTCSEALFQLELPQPVDADGDADSLNIEISTPPINGTVNLEGLSLSYRSNVGFSGTEEIVVTVCDSLYPFDDCSDLTILLNVSPNTAPVVKDSNITIPYETQEIICIDVQDADEDPTTINIIEEPDNGVLEPASSTCSFYTPADNFYGQDTMVVVACDNCNACDTASVFITVPPPADPPIVSDTTVTTTYDLPITVCLDIEEPNGEPVDLTLLTTPTNGTITLQNDSCLLYTPSSESAYTENISIDVCDILNNCTNITLTINVTEPINLPPTVSDTTATTTSNVGVTFCFEPEDPENDVLEMTILTNPIFGAAGVAGNSCIVYASDPNFFGIDSVQVQFCDPRGNCVTAWGVITVFPSEDLAPVVNDTTVTVNALEPSIVCLDIEELNGDDYSIVFDTASNEPVSIDSDCFQFTSLQGFLGEISYTANVCDENNNCTTITVTYIVVPVGNIAPVVEPIAPIRLNVGDTEEACIEATDPNDDELSYQIIDISPSNIGAVGFNENCISFEATDGSSGTVSVTVNVCDGQECTPITIEFQINATPSVTPDAGSLEVNQGENVTTCLTIVDAEGDPTNLSIVQDSDNANVSLQGGCLVYAPIGDFVGTEIITVEVCDNLGACTTVSIEFTTLDVLSTTDDAFTIEDNNSLTANFVENDVFQDINFLTINIINSPSNGNLSFGENGIFTYTPNPDFVGTDVFSYELCLSNVGCEQATVTITVENLLEALNDTANTLQNTLSIDIAILDNDAFPDLEGVDVEIIEGVSNGSLALEPTTFVATYFPDADFAGTDSFEYALFYPNRGFDTARVIIIVVKELIPPTATDDSATTLEEETVNIDVLANDIGEGLFLSRITDAPINGTATIDSDGTISYTPNAGFIGMESFVYEVCSVDDLCTTATVRVEVEEKDIVVVCEVKVYPAVTPNGDGKNEQFVIEGLDCGGNDQNELIIFNRWGDEVYRTENYGSASVGFWDARYSGASEAVPDGTYFYVLTIEGEDVVEKGFLEVQK